MPEVNFAITDKLDNIAGLSDSIISKLAEGKYPDIHYKVTKLSDIKKEDLDKLPREAYLTIKHTRGKPYTRQEVKHVADEVMKKYNFRGEITGSYRRLKDKLNDIDILTTTMFTAHDDQNVILIRHGDVRIKMLFKSTKYNEYFPVDILFTTKERYPFALMHFTGSKEFNIHMSKHAIGMGMKLSVNGLYKGGIFVNGIKSEKDIFTKLKLKYIPPEKRNN
jgi:DNA polymerase/3'-5' exonuclease PolX